MGRLPHRLAVHHPWAKVDRPDLDLSQQETFQPDDDDQEDQRHRNDWDTYTDQDTELVIIS